MEIEVRDTTVDDAEAFTNAFDVVARERKYILSTQAGTVAQTVAYIEYVHSLGGVHKIVVLDNKIIGFCTVGFAPFEGFKHSGRLGMGVLPEFRHQKIGSRLLKNVLEAAFRKPIERIELEVFASNLTAMALYKKFGFITEGKKINARKLDGVYEDIVLMAVTKEKFEREILCN